MQDCSDSVWIKGEVGPVSNTGRAGKQLLARCGCMFLDLVYCHNILTVDTFTFLEETTETHLVAANYKTHKI